MNALRHVSSDEDVSAVELCLSSGRRSTSCLVPGHIGISVPDIDAACKLFQEQQVTFVKKPDSGESAGSWTPVTPVKGTVHHQLSRQSRSPSLPSCGWMLQVLASRWRSGATCNHVVTCVLTGKMKNLAFIQDPDGYWIEILSPDKMLPLMSP